MAGAIAAALAIKVNAKDSPPLLGYIGRFHILALHVPIGILTIALVAEVCTFLKKGRRSADVVVGFALPLLVATGFGAIILGLLLAHSGGYPDKLVSPHRNFTIIGIFFAGIATLLWDRRRQAGRWIHRGVLGVSALAMTIGAHFGGSMTHGSDFLFPDKDKPAAVADEDAGAPDTSASALPSAIPAGTPLTSDAAAPIADAGSEASAPVVDAGPPKPTNLKVVQGIVARRCNPCHTVNQKGGLKINFGNPAAMKKGDFVAGHPESSKLYTNLVLPLDDDDHMPPEKEAQLTKGEIAAFRAWIADPNK
jgi:hypothetical protein